MIDFFLPLFTSSCPNELVCRLGVGVEVIELLVEDSEYPRDHGAGLCPRRLVQRRALEDTGHLGLVRGLPRQVIAAKIAVRLASSFFELRRDRRGRREE